MTNTPTCWRSSWVGGGVFHKFYQGNWNKTQENQTKWKPFNQSSNVSDSSREQVSQKYTKETGLGISQIGSFHNLPLLIAWNTHLCYGLPRWLSGKESACQCRRCKRCWFDLWVGKISWRRKWQPTPVFLPGKFHGQMNLASYCPVGLQSQTRLCRYIHIQACAHRHKHTHTHN